MHFRCTNFRGFDRINENHEYSVFNYNKNKFTLFYNDLINSNRINIHCTTEKICTHIFEKINYPLSFHSLFEKDRHCLYVTE
jgi:hypothetical protein